MMSLKSFWTEKKLGSGLGIFYYVRSLWYLTTQLPEIQQSFVFNDAHLGTALFFMQKGSM